MQSVNAPLPRQQSSTLVIGMAGRIGSGVSFVRDKLLQSLRTFAYDVDIVDVTALIEQFENQLEQQDLEGIDQDLQSCDIVSGNEAGKRVRKFQLVGNALRRKYGNEVLAALAVTDFIRPDIEEGSENMRRKAYVVDSLKHPEEVRLLRNIFGNLFWMVGVVSSDLSRFNRLKQKKEFTEGMFNYLSEEDAEGDDKRDTDSLLQSGQATVKTVLEADYFFANDFATKDEIEEESARLSRLMFGIQVVSPTENEVGMNAAYQASLRSACLSRQVGAAIVAATGEILSTGHNDVPKFGGGLYGPSPANRDRRCWAWGAKCYNDEEKLKITRQVVDVLVDGRLLEASKKAEAVELLRKSRISGLIEFTRAVHAEMEAMLSIARVGTSGILGSTLYTTTYPCHNCAKHIVDAGIKRVVYLEPYEKSLARTLHPDAINDPLGERDDQKVSIDNYGGISPRRFSDFFLPKAARKVSGRFVDDDRKRHNIPPILREEVSTIRDRIQTLQAWMDNGTSQPRETQEPLPIAGNSQE